MPLAMQNPPSPTTLPVHEKHKKQSLQTKQQDDKEDRERLEELLPPTSPRVRRRLDDAKESESLFGPVCEQGEVIQWMSACHPDLIDLGRELERRGYRTLCSIAFLTEEDLSTTSTVIDAPVKQLLLATLARLRHEFFRM